MEKSSRVAELTTLLESFLNHFYTHFQVDEIGRYDDLVSFLLVLCLLLSVVIFLMEGTHSKKKRKAKATTSASAGVGGSNANDDDERKREDEYYLFKIQKTEKQMSKFLYDFTRIDHPIPFPRSPSQKAWLTVTKSVCKGIYPEDAPRMRSALLSGFYTRLTMNTSQNPDFPQFVEAMRKFLEDNL